MNFGGTECGTGRSLPPRSSSLAVGVLGQRDGLVECGTGTLLAHLGPGGRPSSPSTLPTQGSPSPPAPNPQAGAGAPKALTSHGPEDGPDLRGESRQQAE